MTNALGNSKLSHSTSSLVSHIRSGSDLGSLANVNTKLSENLLQIFHPHSGLATQQNLPPLHPHVNVHSSKLYPQGVLRAQPNPTLPHLKSQISDPHPEPRLKLKLLAKSATTSAILGPDKSRTPPIDNLIHFDFVSQLSLRKYQEFLQQNHTPHDLMKIWTPERSPKGNQPGFYQKLLSGHFALHPKFSRRLSQSRKFSALKEFRRLKLNTRRQYQGKWNLTKKLILRTEPLRVVHGPIKSSYSRQTSNEDRGVQSKWQSMENIFTSGGRENKRAFKIPSQANVALAQKGPLLFTTGGSKWMSPMTAKSMFGGSCGNIYDKTKRRNSGFEHPAALYSPAYNHTIIGVESIRLKLSSLSGYKSPRTTYLGIGDIDLPGDDLQPIRDDDGFSDVGFEGTFEDCDEDGETEEECAMDFDSESLSSNSSEIGLGLTVNEYRYRNSRHPFTLNPLYKSDYTSSCSSMDINVKDKRNRKTKREPRRALVAFKQQLSSSRRSSGTDLEVNQKQRQGQFKSFGKLPHLPPKRSPSQGSSAGSRDGKRIIKYKSRGDVYETLNEDLAMFQHESRRSDDRFGSRNKSSSTVPHSRTGSPCSVNSLHLTTRSNTPTQFQMHFNPIHPAVVPGNSPANASQRKLKKGQSANSFLLGAMGRVGSKSTFTTSSSAGGVGNVANTLPEQKLSVRTKIKSISLNLNWPLLHSKQQCGVLFNGVRNEGGWP